jgi:hypothetical protein
VLGKAEAMQTRRLELQRPDVDRKLLGLVVHGIGEQPRGWSLKHMANEFLPLIRSRIDPLASLAAKPMDEDGPAEVFIWFRDQIRNEVYELRFIEVWWSHTFVPLSLGDFISGTWHFGIAWCRRRGTRRWGALRCAGWLIVSFVWLLVRRLSRALAFACVLPIAVPFTIIAANETRTPGRRARAYEWLLAQIRDGQVAIVELVVLLLAPVLLGLLLSLWLLEPIRSAGVLPDFVVRIQKALVNVLTRHLGDMWTYMRRPWEASQIRVRFEERFRELLDTVKEDQAGERKLEAAFVLAHSMGTVVSHEAMTGRRFIQLTNDTLGTQLGVKFHFITVGSALNFAWDIASSDERFRFYRHMHPAVRWLNVYSREDPVPRGPLRRPSEVNQVWQWGGPASFHNLEVVNQMDLFSDHSAYWSNAEHVIAPILNRLTSYRLADRLRMRREARRRRVSVLSALKAVAWVIGPAVFLLALWLDWGGVVAGWSDAVLPDDRNTLQDAIFYVSRAGLWGAVFAVAAAVIYSTLVKWMWDLFDHRAKYRWPKLRWTNHPKSL